MKHFNSISELYEWSNLHRQIANEDFDIIDFPELGTTAKSKLPPHRRSFYTIIFFENQKDGKIQIDKDELSLLRNTLIFHNHLEVFSFTRDQDAQGKIVLFQPNFLLPNSTNIQEDFPFFTSDSINSFHLSDTNHPSVKQLLELMYQNRETPQICKHLLLSLLYLCKNYVHIEQSNLSVSKKIVRLFFSHINSYCFQEKAVGYYAKLQNISPSYLNEVVKRHTNTSAKRWILERVLLESKNLLLYSEMDISEISHVLNFKEPSHFNRFFKKEMTITPNQFRAENRKNDN